MAQRKPKLVFHRPRSSASPPPAPSPPPPVEQVTERPARKRDRVSLRVTAPGGSPVKDVIVFGHLPSESTREVTDIRRYLEQRRRRDDVPEYDLTYTTEREDPA